MNAEELDKAAKWWFSGTCDATELDAFRAGALWHEQRMIDARQLTRLVGGPRDGSVVPMPPFGDSIIYRRTDDSGVTDTIYRLDGGVFRHVVAHDPAHWG